MEGFFKMEGFAFNQVILYSSIFLYKVVSPIFNKRAVSVLFPLVWFNILCICSFSTLARSKAERLMFFV